MSPPYAELQVATNFSFLRGASHAEELVITAKALGLSAIGVADRNSLAGVVRAHTAARQHGLRLLVGARLVPEEGPEILCYPCDRAAYGRLCRLLTIGKRRAEKGDCRFTLADLHGVLGDPIPAEPTQAFLQALSAMTVTVTTADGAVLATAPGSSVLGHPLNAMLWLRNNGVVFDVGDLVSVGSIGPLLVPEPGLTATVTYTGLPGNPRVSVSFE